MLISKKGKTKLYTRGDGIIGSDISYLTHYLKNIPKKINEDIAIRGELIIRKDVFTKKYSSEFKNPRNMVAGRIAGKTARSGLEDIEFIAYEIIDNHTLIKPEEQLLKLVEMDFHVVNYSIVNSLKIENLIEIFMNFKDNTIFEIDGIIIQPNIPYKRNKSGNPSYAFAFKVRLDTNLVDAEVEEVEWNISRWGLLKPKIRIKPVFLNGVTITYTSGFNARYIEDNQIGPKSIIKLTRSGDVIPFIVEVIKKTKAQMPDIPYKWNETHVDIYTEENENIVCIKVITNIFASLNIKHVSELTVSKLYNHGLDNLLKIIYASKEDFEDIEGFGKRLAERTYNNIHAGLQNISLSTLLGGSGIFGRGIGAKKIQVLLQEIPDILELYSTISKKKLFKMINEVKGFSDKTTKNIIDNLPWAIKFVEKMKPFISIKIVKNISK
jgi:NAD-dependent DNA ligase